MVPEQPLPVTSSSVEELARQVKGLKSAYETYRRLVKAMVGVIVITLLTVAWVWFVAEDASTASTQANQAIEENRNSQVVNCQNGNESRQATLELWTFVLSLSSVNASPEVKAEIFAPVSLYIQQLYAPRDCSDLTRKFKPPAPPDIDELMERVDR